MKILKHTILVVVAACNLHTAFSQNVIVNAPSANDVAKISNDEFIEDWNELDKRPLPEWFNEAKFGIFITWGLYSVPSYSPVGPNGYSEWYWSRLRNGDKAFEEFHKSNYGDKPYEEFAKDLTAEFFDADQWCDIFERSGAKYVLTTSNYHDGFAMYPTKYSRTKTTDRWNSTEVGPMRDVIGELKEAGEKRNLKMGIYYSLYEWYHPLWLSDRDKFVTEQLFPKFKEVVERYKPWTIFLDGEWSMSGEKWKTNKLAQWLYNESSVKDVVVVNDRWGSSRGRFGDVFESEYGYGKWTSPEHPWQEDRGIGQSYGYNRAEGIDDYSSADELLEQLTLVTAGGGNFLLGIGATADGRIPVIMQQRLLEIGEWLKVNGEAIYGAKASPFWPRTFDWGAVTAKENAIYLHIFDSNCREIALDGIDGKITKVELLCTNGNSKTLKFKHKRDKLKVNIPIDCELQQTINVIKVSYSGELHCDKRQYSSADGNIFLTGRVFEYSSSKIKAVYGGFRERMNMTGWNNPEDYAKTNIVIDEPGKYEIKVAYNASGNNIGSEIEVSIAGQTLTHTTVHSVENSQYTIEPISIGTVNIKRGGDYTLKIGAKKGGKWSGFNFQSIQIDKKEI